MHYIHVNVNQIRSNAKRIKDEGIATLVELAPVVTTKPTRGRTGKYGHRVAILDREGNAVAHVVYDPFHPLPCGAKCYIEAEYGSEVVG